jgi:hypothetical protein
MVMASLETLLKIAQEHPQDLQVEADALTAEMIENDDVIRMFSDCCERFENDWQQVSALRKSVDESLHNARQLYKAVLKKSESFALQGRPRLYWLAKSLFAQLRRHSLEYQIQEAEAKIHSLQVAKQQLQSLLNRMQTDITEPVSNLLEERENSEMVSRRHGTEMRSLWEQYSGCQSKNSELREKIQRFEIEKAVTEALVSEMSVNRRSNDATVPVRVIDSPKMLTSTLPFLGFSNRPKLKTNVEQAEYAAIYAEKDLEKVRDGVRLANEAAVHGRATSVSIDWINYCRLIVTRYEELLKPQVTPY